MIDVVVEKFSSGCEKVGDFCSVAGAVQVHHRPWQGRTYHDWMACSPMEFELQVTRAIVRSGMSDVLSGQSRAALRC